MEALLQRHPPMMAAERVPVNTLGDYARVRVGNRSNGLAPDGPEHLLGDGDVHLVHRGAASAFDPSSSNCRPTDR